MRKSALIIFGLFLGALILEAALRLAGGLAISPGRIIRIAARSKRAIKVNTGFYA